MDGITTLKLINDKLLDVIHEVEEDAAEEGRTQSEIHDLEVAQNTYVTVLRYVQDLLQLLEAKAASQEEN